MRPRSLPASVLGRWRTHVASRRSLWRYIRDFVSRGGSVLLTTHYLEEADALADRVVVLNRGRIVASGSPEQIKTRTALKTIRCITSLDEALIGSCPGVARTRRDGVHTEIQAANTESVVAWMLREDTRLADLEIRACALEDAFLDLTRGTKAPEQNESWRQCDEYLFARSKV